jgi:microsomal dipeptidase-like Zn-dependent dipeptidase
VKRAALRRAPLGLVAQPDGLRPRCGPFVEAFEPSGRAEVLVEDSIAALTAHIDRIVNVTGSWDHMAIGSDLDGFQKPTLTGLQTMATSGSCRRRWRHATARRTHLAPAAATRCGVVESII